MSAANSAVTKVVIAHEISEAEREEKLRQSVDCHDELQTAPRDIMKNIFALQGMCLDPQNIKVLVDQIKKCCSQGYGDGESKFDCFLSYRVATDRDTVEKVYWLLKATGYHPFLDSICLKEMEEWKSGFLTGLKKSRVFIAFISRRALEGPRSFDRDHRRDSVLLEYEMALGVMKALGNSKYILPLLVGEYHTVGGQSALVKFQDFNPSLYSPSLVPSSASVAVVSASATMPSSPSPSSHSQKTRPLKSLSCVEVHALLKTLKICDNLQRIEEEGVDGLLLWEIKNIQDIEELQLSLSGIKSRKLLGLLMDYRDSGVSLELLQ